MSSPTGLMTRDVLSVGYASMLLYAMLFGFTIDNVIAAAKFQIAKAR